MADLKKEAEALIKNLLKEDKTPKEILEALEVSKNGSFKGKVFVIEVDGEGDDVAVGYCYQPNRQALAAALSLIDKDPLRANESLLRNVWLGGDDRLLNEDDFFLGCLEPLGQLISFKTGRLKKI